MARKAVATAGDAGFSGFGPQALPFLQALAFHQAKEWFETNRAIYEAELRRPLAALLAELTRAFAEAGLPLRGDERGIFRLHRDIRFSRDKRPYKTNAGALLTRTGRKDSPGLLYLHLEPEGCFAAAGFWQPPPDDLAALRRAIRDRPDAFRDVLARLAAAGLVLGDGDPLARAPKGFEDVADPDGAAAIRMRNLVVRRSLAAEALGGREFVGALLRFGEDAAPLLRFGWQALGDRPA